MASRVLITGVSGFVGGALGCWLRQRDARHVTGVSRRPARPGSIDAHITHDLSKAAPPVEAGPFDAIVHCAALSSPWASPREFQAHNVDATRHMVNYAREWNCRKFVYISSSAVYYRHGDQFDVTEDMPLPETPINDYAATKRQAEDFVQQSGLDAVIFRPRAVFGPGDTVLFPRLLRAARHGMLPVITRPDGRSAIGDLIYIDNLCHYIQCALQSNVTGAFTLTNNQPVELYPFLRSVLDSLGLPAPERRVPVNLALGAASILETVSRLLFSYREPPITRFGVEMLAYSKTFNVAKSLREFGPPPIANTEAIRRFIQWQKSQPIC